MQQSTNSIQNEIVNTINKIKDRAKIKIWEAIDQQLPFVIEKLQSDNIAEEAIEKIIKDVAEKQYQISMKEFNKIFLLKQEEIFPSRVIKKKWLKNEV